MNIKINDSILNFVSVNFHGFNSYGTTECGKEFLLFENRDAAKSAVEKYFDDLSHDANSFLEYFGAENVVNWAVGLGSFSAYIEYIKPVEHFATYDGIEYDLELLPDAEDIETDDDAAWERSEDFWFEELGFIPKIAYRI